LLHKAYWVLADGKPGRWYLSGADRINPA
jgi:hypothetical protein